MEQQDLCYALNRDKQEWVVVTKIKNDSGDLEGFEISINNKEIYLDIELAKCVAKEILDSLRLIDLQFLYKVCIIGVVRLQLTGHHSGLPPDHHKRDDIASMISAFLF